MPKAISSAWGTFDLNLWRLLIWSVTLNKWFRVLTLFQSKFCFIHMPVFRDQPYDIAYIIWSIQYKLYYSVVDQIVYYSRCTIVYQIVFQRGPVEFIL